MREAYQPTMKDEISQLESRMAALKEKAKFSRDEASEAVKQQVRALENQYKYCRTKVDNKRLESKLAYNEMTEAAQKAWDELWTGVDQAFKQIH